MLNKSIIMGRLCANPELKYTQSQIPVVTFNVAVDRDYTGEDKQREADFITVVAWRSTAEFISRNFAKGAMIIVEGRIQTRSWTDQQHKKRKETEIVADNVYFGGSSKRDNGTQDAANPIGYNSADFAPGTSNLSPADFVPYEDDDSPIF